MVVARVVLPGTARGAVLRLDRPISFWGGIDPATSALTDPRGPAPGTRIAGRVLMLPGTRGSSSSSAVMLELIRAGIAPAAVVTGRLDAILGLGIVVARELGLTPPPLLELAPEDQARFADGATVEIDAGGRIVSAA